MSAAMRIWNRTPARGVVVHPPEELRDRVLEGE